MDKNDNNLGQRLLMGQLVVDRVGSGGSTVQGLGAECFSTEGLTVLAFVMCAGAMSPTPPALNVMASTCRSFTAVDVIIFNSI